MPKSGQKVCEELPAAAAAAASLADCSEHKVITEDDSGEVLSTPLFSHLDCSGRMLRENNDWRDFTEKS